MPKLNKQAYEAVNNAEEFSGDFSPLEPGKYVGVLIEVDVQEHPNHANVMVWNAIFAEIHDLEGNKKPGRQWHRLNVILDRKMPATYQKDQETWDKFVGVSDAQVKGFFTSMGYTVDSDTDEMIGEAVILKLGIRTIQSGQRAGEKANNVQRLISIEDEAGAEEVAQTATAGQSGDPEDRF